MVKLQSSLQRSGPETSHATGSLLAAAPGPVALRKASAAASGAAEHDELAEAAAAVGGTRAQVAAEALPGFPSPAVAFGGGGARGARGKGGAAGAAGAAAGGGRGCGGGAGGGLKELLQAALCPRGSRAGSAAHPSPLKRRASSSQNWQSAPLPTGSDSGAGISKRIGVERFETGTSAEPPPSPLLCVKRRRVSDGATVAAEEAALVPALAAAHGLWRGAGAGNEEAGVGVSVDKFQQLINQDNKSLQEQRGAS